MKKPFAFVLMPFEPEFDDIYKIGILEAAAAANVHGERLDDQIFSEGILERIFAQIEKADIIVADMTNRNANVFYEVGYARAKEKLTILITKDAADIPFDLKHQRHIVYGDSLHELRSQLTKHLEWAVKECAVRENAGLKVDFEEPVTSLSKSDYAATASFVLTTNLTGLSSGVTISGITLYGGKWTVKQDGQTCSARDSDVTGYEKRYFLKSPISRIEKGVWAPLVFEASRVVATSWKKGDIKDEYTLSIRGLVRIATSSGTFDFVFEFEGVKCEVEIFF